MRSNQEVERDEVSDEMRDEVIPGFKITIEATEDRKGTYIHDDPDEEITRIHIDPIDRLDLVNQVNKLLVHLRAYHHSMKAGCVDCGSEVMVSGTLAPTESHEVGIDCPECDGRMINLDGGDSDE